MSEETPWDPNPTLYMAITTKTEHLAEHRGRPNSVYVIRCTSTGMVGGSRFGPVASFTYVAKLDGADLASQRKDALLLQLHTVGVTESSTDQDESVHLLMPGVLQLLSKWELAARRLAANAAIPALRLIQPELAELSYLVTHPNHTTASNITSRARRLAEIWVDALGKTPDGPPFRTPGQRERLIRYAEVAIIYITAPSYGQDPTDAVAKAAEVSPSTARSLVHRARQRGLLAPVPKMVNYINLSANESRVVDAVLPRAPGDFDPDDERRAALERIDELSKQIESLRRQVAGT